MAAGALPKASFKEIIDRRVGRNEPIVLDYVFAFQGYISDHTRVFSLGELPADLVQDYDACLTIESFGFALGEISAAASIWRGSRSRSSASEEKGVS